MPKFIAGATLFHTTIDMGIFRGVFMPLRAMGFYSLPSTVAAQVSPLGIDTMRHGFKMVGTHTGPILTKVVYFVAIWDRTIGL